MSSSTLLEVGLDLAPDAESRVLPDILDSYSLEMVIQRHRQGEPIALVCQIASNGFSPSLAYPIQRIAQGKGVVVVNDAGEECTIDGESRHLGKFLIASSPQDASALCARLQQEAVTRIADAGVAFLQTNKFSLGSMVQWKPGMRVARLLAYGQPAVVLQVLNEPIVDEDASAMDPSRAHMCDLLIGVETPNHQFMTFYADSRRLEHFTYQAVRNGALLTEFLDPNPSVSNPGVH